MRASSPLAGPRLFRALHYFEAVARLGSVAGAAAEAGVSPSAVSHQIRDLAASLGEELFTRSGRGLVPTDTGTRLARRLGATFADLDAVVAEVVGRSDRVLRLAVCSSFGPGWLAPRLPDLARVLPGLALELRLYAEDPELTQAVADAIVTARDVRPGYDAIDLFEEHLVAVERPGAHPDPDLGSGPGRQLITTDIDEGRVGADWLDYAALVGADRAALGRPDPLRCSHYALALALARAGLGAALVPDFLAAEHLSRGTLVTLGPARLRSGRTYRLCRKAARGQDPDLRALGRWMRAQARQPA